MIAAIEDAVRGSLALATHDLESYSTKSNKIINNDQSGNVIVKRNPVNAEPIGFPLHDCHGSIIAAEDPCSG